MSQPQEPRKPTPEASQPDSTLDEAVPGGSYNVDPDTADKVGVEQETLEDKDSVPAPEGEGTERE